MDIDTIWKCEPKIIRAYLNKYDLEMDKINYTAWLNGFYMYDAVAVVLSNVLSKKGGKQNTYFERPIKEFNFVVEEQTDEEKMTDKYKTSYNYWAKLKGNAKRSQKGGM